MRTPWTVSRIAVLKSMWAQDYTASWIAQELGGVSRNAVIGKVHRLGLVKRLEPAPKLGRKPRVPKPQRQVDPKPRISIADIPVSPERQERVSASLPALVYPPSPERSIPREQAFMPRQAGQGVHILKHRDKQCRWPLSGPNETTTYFCGAEAGIEEPYCPAHRQLAYAPAVHQSREVQRRWRAS